MRNPLALAALALTLTACGSGSPSATETVTVTPPASSAAAPTTTPAATAMGESDGCRVAASKWADRMTDHVLDASTTAPGLAETVKLNDTNDATSTIKALCSDAILKPVLQANSNMAGANYQLALCAVNPDLSGGFGPSCPKPLAKKVRAIASKTAPLVGQVRNLI